MTFEASERDDFRGAKMDDRDNPSEERRNSAAIFARLLCQSVKSQFPGDWYGDDALKCEAIDERRSASIMEFGRRKWPRRYRLSIHSDCGGSLVGYGVFRPPNMNRRSNDEGLREYLAAGLPGGWPTPVHWAWYREMAEPLRDFSQKRTSIEVEKIRQGEASGGDDALRQARDDLALLAAALDGWYFRIQPTPD
jgi:hypothetical protein